MKQKVWGSVGCANSAQGTVTKGHGATLRECFSGAVGRASISSGPRLGTRCVWVRTARRAGCWQDRGTCVVDQLLY